MKCSVLLQTKQMILIALAIGLSNTFYAQYSLERPTNDICSEAILLEAGTESTFTKYNMAGTGRSISLLPSLCEEDVVAKRDVWFITKMPMNGKLDVFLRSDQGSPALAIYKGNCKRMSYLACDASKQRFADKMISLREPALANTDLLIRVFSTDTFASNTFEIKAETNNSTNTIGSSMTADYYKQSVQISWTSNAETHTQSTLLQHSTDQAPFSTICHIKGRNIDAIEQHAYTHRQPQPGRNDYRLMTVNPHGEQTILDERTIYVDRNSANVRVYPNPASERVTLQVPSWASASPADLHINGILGQHCHYIPLEISPGQPLHFDLNRYQLQEGIYYLNLVQGDELLIHEILNIKR